MTNKFALRKHKYYIDNEALNTGDHEKLVNLLIGYINSQDTENAKDIAYILLQNDFLDSRENKIPEGVPYSKVETPILSLKFAYALEKLYYQTGILNYHEEASTIIQRLNNNLTLDKTAGLTTFIQLYGADNNALGTFRSGTYISDLMPAVWNMFDFSENTTEIINYYKLAQKDFESKSGRRSVFSPVYLRNLPENSTYGTLESWAVNGPNGDETSFIHQYSALLNLCIYYYEKFKATGNKDKLAKIIINNFFEWFFSRNDIPTDINYTGLYVDNEDIFIDNMDIFIDHENIYAFETNGYNQDFAVIIALSCLYKFKVDKEQAYYNYPKTIVNNLLASQNADGSFTFNYSFTEGYAQSLLYLYNNLHEQSYFDIINDAFKLFKLDYISELNKTTHPQRIALAFCKQGIDQILLKRFFKHTYTETELTYTAGNNEYSLSDLGINPHRIDQIYFYDNEQFCELKELSYINYLEAKNRDNSESKPERFCIDNDTLYLHKIPDKNYSIKISHYKVEDDEISYSKIPELLPQKWYHVLKWFIANRLAVHREDKRLSVFETLYRKSLSNMEYGDSVDLSEGAVRASNVRWQ